MPPASQRLLSGHRGIPSQAPENTLTSFQLACEKGASWIETDVQLSADKVPVIIHDRKVNRTTDGKGVVSEMMAKDIFRLDAGSWFDKTFKGETVPSLEETLALCLKLGLSLNLELKIHTGNSVEELAQQVTSVVKFANFPLDSLIFSSFSQEALKYCQQLYPEARRGIITEDNHLDIEPLIKAYDLYSVHLHHKLATPGQVNALKEKGIMVAIWTMNDASKSGHYFDMGVDNIMSDNVDLF